MSRNPKDEHKLRAALRALRSTLLIAIFTFAAVYFNRRGFYPHGNPLIFAIAISWLIAITVAMPSSIIFLRVNVKLFSLARWERQGRIYDRNSVRAFRWVLLHSPLGWINPNLHFGPSRSDCERLLREMNVSEGAHWLSCFLSSVLAIAGIVRGYTGYGYVILLLRVPFDLYPIMLHRRNRGRVYRVLSRQLRTSG